MYRIINLCHRCRIRISTNRVAIRRGGGLVLLIVYGSTLWNWCKRRREIVKAVDAFPGEKWYPIIGTSLTFLVAPREKRWKIFKELQKQFGPTSRAWMGNIPIVLISKPEHLELIFKSNVSINKGIFYNILKPWLGEGLVTAHGFKWKEHRRLLTPAFHFKILDKYTEVFSEKAIELARILEEKVGDEYFEASVYFTRCALDIISETAMGVKFNALRDPTCEYANAIFGLCEIISLRTDNPLLGLDFIFNFTNEGKRFSRHLKTIQDTTNRIIETRREEFKLRQVGTGTDDLGRKEKLAFLDILLESEKENKFTNKEIADEVNTFMFAGQDTTASTVTYALLALGNYLDIQTKVQEELDAIFHGEERPISPQDISSMEYLDRVVKETLRMFTFVPNISRVLEEDIVIDGHRIPAGVTMGLSLYDLHHNAEHWPDPERFDPDRFLPEFASKRHPYAFAPFSAGPRNCIGQKFGTRNSKTLLAAILRKYKVKCLETPETLEEYAEIVLRPQQGLHLQLQLRK